MQGQNQQFTILSAMVYLTGYGYCPTCDKKMTNIKLQATKQFLHIMHNELNG